MCKTIDESKARPDVGCTELLADDARSLCWDIEAIPASIQQTDISIKANALFARCQKADAAITKALDLLNPPLNGPAIQARRVLQSLSANAESEVSE